MRTVHSHHIPDLSLLPDAAQLEDARGLVTRFADLGLREISVVRAESLDARAGKNIRVWLAMESMQATGSFKVRGAVYAMAKILARDPKAKILAVSAGNHGAGVAFAARALGADVTVVVPKTAALVKREKIAGFGAKIVLVDGGYDVAEAQAKSMARESGAHFLSPYDDADVVTGNGASIGFEIVRALHGVPDLVLVPFGGGGLASGVASALRVESMSGERPVWGVQSEASSAMAMSLEQNRAVVELPACETFAEGLEGGISERGFARARGVVAGVVVVDERSIGAAMTWAKHSLDAPVEGSAAVALVPVMHGIPADLFTPNEKTAKNSPKIAKIAGDIAGDTQRDVVVLLTGRNVDDAELARAVLTSAP